MKTVRYVTFAVTLAFAALLAPGHAMAQQSQPTEESKKLPVGSAEERKARMSARANAPAYTKKFDLSGLPHYVPEEKPKGALRIAGNNYVGDSPLGGVFTVLQPIPANADAHVAPQAIPSGDEVTLPRPVPCLATVRAKIGLVVVHVYLDGGLVFPNWLVAVTWKVCFPRVGRPG